MDWTPSQTHSDPSSHRPSLSAASSNTSSTSLASAYSFHLAGSAAPLPSPSAAAGSGSGSAPGSLGDRGYFGSFFPASQDANAATAQQGFGPPHPQHRYNLRSLQSQQQQQQYPQRRASGGQMQQQRGFQPALQSFAAQQAYSQPIQRHDSGGAESALYLRDFGLLAEAAKRAQVACVVRDFEEISL